MSYASGSSRCLNNGFRFLPESCLAQQKVSSSFREDQATGKRPTLDTFTPKKARLSIASISCSASRACWYSRFLSPSGTPSRCMMYVAMIRSLSTELGD